MKSKYSYHFTGDVLVINDLGGNRSVTNDLEDILKTIHLNQAFDFTGAKIIYSDTFGKYDGLLAINESTSPRPEYKIDFVIFQAETEHHAITLINEYHERATATTGK